MNMNTCKSSASVATTVVSSSSYICFILLWCLLLSLQTLLFDLYLSARIYVTELLSFGTIFCYAGLFQCSTCMQLYFNYQNYFYSLLPFVFHFQTSNFLDLQLLFFFIAKKHSLLFYCQFFFLQISLPIYDFSSFCLLIINLIFVVVKMYVMFGHDHFPMRAFWVILKKIISDLYQHILHCQCGKYHCLQFRFEKSGVFQSISDLLMGDKP